jgi:hypothetical protein
MKKTMVLPASQFLHPTFHRRLWLRGHPVDLKRGGEGVRVHVGGTNLGYSVSEETLLTLEVKV